MTCEATHGSGYITSCTSPHPGAGQVQECWVSTRDAHWLMKSPWGWNQYLIVLVSRLSTRPSMPSQCLLVGVPEWVFHGRVLSSSQPTLLLAFASPGGGGRGDRHSEALPLSFSLPRAEGGRKQRFVYLLLFPLIAWLSRMCPQSRGCSAALPTVIDIVTCVHTCVHTRIHTRVHMRLVK